MADAIGEAAGEGARDDTDETGLSRGQWAAAGVAMGIGSAGLVAALLYAGRHRKPKQRPRTPDDFMD